MYPGMRGTFEEHFELHYTFITGSWLDWDLVSDVVPVLRTYPDGDREDPPEDESADYEDSSEESGDEAQDYKFPLWFKTLMNSQVSSR